MRRLFAARRFRPIFQKAAWATALALSFAMADPARGLAQDAAAATGKKLEAAIACLNRLSERALDSRNRYMDWAGDKAKMKSKPRNVLGLYTIYETADCASGVAEAASATPKHAALESASANYVKSVQALEPMLKAADDYYEQENYKDDKFAKGKEMHGKLLAAWEDFAKVDRALRDVVESVSDERQTAELARIETAEGRSAKFLVMNTFLRAKALVRAESGADMDKLDLNRVIDDLEEYEKALKELETFAENDKNGKIDSFFVNTAKDVLVTAKGLMRRVRDKTGFDSGEKMMMSQPGAGWMVEGSQPRLIRDFNQLVDNYNRM